VRWLKCSAPPAQAQDVAAEAEDDELDELLDFAKNLGIWDIL
jgi:hypothetical protein